MKQKRAIRSNPRVNEKERNDGGFRLQKTALTSMFKKRYAKDASDLADLKSYMDKAARRVK